MTEKEIILACRHEVETPCEIDMGDGTKAKCCCDCWNASRVAAKASRKAWLQDQKNKGADYWRARGIAIGETVEMTGWNLFSPFIVRGVAKVGAAGAYVSSDYPTCRGRQLDPSTWRKCEAKPAQLEFPHE